MDKKRRLGLDSILQKISSKDLVGAELQDSNLVYSVVGFIPACDFVDNAMLISNLGYLLSQKGLNTCVVDLKVFYPNLYSYLDVLPHKKGNGLIKVLKSDKVDFRDELQLTKYERLYLLSPSPQDLIEEYFDFEFENVERVITTLKQMFDIVLIDIPNNPPLEFCLGAMKYSHIGFFTATERMEAASNMVKLLDYAKSVGISTAKFTSVILMNLQNLEFDYKVMKETGFNIVTALPLVKDAVARAHEGKLYIKDDPLVNKHFRKEIQKLADHLADQ
ncbi:MinD-like ATPase involved in chromosome partitioning or flagellar assembly [Paenibacillus castaneae]|uniref:ATPase n=1 Tax=Paenibacillus castaneae TaxID=474957 RepID=UPI000C998130|nr:ATPase [Paenibacillus castaneae]NIK77488.1 MinD-like ATPase involved in chromosome partitioning or flagellar assembly [Paenibacillus castaneae]